MSTLILILLLALPTPAQADDIDVSLRNAVLVGKDRPALILGVNRSVKEARFSYKRSDGKSGVASASKLRAGIVKELPLDAPVGMTTFEGTLDVTFEDGGKASMPLAVDIEVVAGFGIDVPTDRVRVDSGELELALTRPAGRCDYAVVKDGGDTLEGTQEYSGEPPGTWLRLHWPGAGGLTLRVTVRCFDAGGVFETGIELYPWKVEIPHEDVVFDSGKWDVKPGELPKVRAAHAEIDAAVRRYGKWIAGVKLYVGGHTDTVGTPDSNRVLSLRRAQAIAKAFRNLGVKVPILYAGFGEDQLAVATPDEKPEARNRRAAYIIGVTPPLPADWTGL